MDTFPVPRPIALEAEPAGLSPDASGLDFDEEVRAPEMLTGRVEFGGPQVAPVDSTYRPEDADLQAFVRAHAGRLRFVLAVMSVNFPFGDPPLATASVEVDLSDDTATGQTLAYTVFPANLGSAKEVTRGFEVKPNLTVAGVGGTLGGPNWSTVDHGSQAYLIGGPELSPHPAWMFRRTPAQAIEGSTRLVMVVQIPLGRVGSLSVSLQASIEKRFRFAKRQIPLPGAGDANPAVITFLYGRISNPAGRQIRNSSCRARKNFATRDGGCSLPGRHARNLACWTPRLRIFRKQWRIRGDSMETSCRS